MVKTRGGMIESGRENINSRWFPRCIPLTKESVKNSELDSDKKYYIIVWLVFLTTVVVRRGL